MLLAACRRDNVWPELRSRVRDTPVTVRRIGDQLFLSVGTGNLARSPAVTAPEREQRFSEFLNDFRGQLQLLGASAPIQFGAAARQVPVGFGDRALHTVYLEPVFEGASVIDRVQSAAYDSASGELRAVLTQSLDYSTLPHPPSADTTVRARATSAVLQRFQLPDTTRVSFRAQPVISAQLRRAGYLIEIREHDEAGAGRWIRALFDPTTNEVLILRLEERDDFAARDARGRL
jgi:hypothetical protein